MNNNPGFSHEDSRDNRTQEGRSPHPVERPDTPDELEIDAPPQDEVNAVNAAASPSGYSNLDIAEGNTPLDDEMESLVDPDFRDEHMSTNPDVLNLDSSWRQEGEEPDFMQDPGTTDVIMAVEEAEPYFPPTDPPLRTGAGLQDAEVLGGFSITSLESPTEPVDEPLRLSGDDEIEARVRYALAADAYTSDLNITVEVEDGTVYLRGQVRSLEDIDQAEQVAGNVAGVDEVQEELEIV